MKAISFYTVLLILYVVTVVAIVAYQYTKYGATDYNNHLAARAGDEEYILFATGAKENLRAQELALALI